jgi:hypothetical protein
MNVNKQLLEEAASAAGHTLVWSYDESLCFLTDTWEGCFNHDEPWNPIRMDADAFRLQVKLKMLVIWLPLHVRVRCGNIHALEFIGSYANSEDPYRDAARRAITRCAARYAPTKELHNA